MTRDFGKQLYVHGSDPLMWREHAIELKIAADALLPQYFSSLREPPAAAGSQSRKFAFRHGYLILVGLAFENAIKGLRIAGDPSLVTATGVKGKILGRGGHGIREGALKYTLLNADEDDVMTRLEEFLFWAAKYPTPLAVDTLANAEINYLRSHISTDPDTLDAVFARLLAAYPD